MKIGRPKNIHIVALLSILFVIGLYYLQTNLLEGFEDNTYDLRMKALRTSPKSRPNIAIIAIDDKTMAELVTKGNVNLESRFGVKVFSLNNWEHFLAWLDSLEAGMSPEHCDGLAAAYP